MTIPIILLALIPTRMVVSGSPATAVIIGTGVLSAALGCPGLGLSGLGLIGIVPTIGAGASCLSGLRASRGGIGIRRSCGLIATGAFCGSHRRGCVFNRIVCGLALHVCRATCRRGDGSTGDRGLCDRRPGGRGPGDGRPCDGGSGNRSPCDRRPGNRGSCGWRPRGGCPGGWRRFLLCFWVGGIIGCLGGC